MSDKTNKFKLIIDCDTGVDDTEALLLALYDPRIDIKLITTIGGNRPIEKITRNTLHVLEKFGFLDIPVSEGSNNPINPNRPRKDASYQHLEEGMGDYKPTAPTILKCIDGEACDNMYKVIKENPHEIIVVLNGPQTNFAMMLQKYPDAKDLVKKVVFMGGAPYGHKKFKKHISFNISYDPEAVNIVLNSGIKDIIMIPSEMGRKYAHHTYQEVMDFNNYNHILKFLHELYYGRWEIGYDDKRVSNNDTVPIMEFLKPRWFTKSKGCITVDTEDSPGKMLIDFKSKSPNATVVMKVKGKKINKYILNLLKKQN